MVQAGFKKPLIEFFKALHSGHGHQVIAPDIPDGPFRAALLVGATRIAEAGLKIIVGPQFAEALLFDAIAPLEDFLHGALQIVETPPKKSKQKRGQATFLVILKVTANRGTITLTYSPKK